MDDGALKDQLEKLQREHAALLERHEALKSNLEAQETLIKLAIIDKAPMPIWACDRNCKIVFWNESAARLYGYSQDEAIGRDFVDLFVDKAEGDQARKDCEDIVDSGRIIRNMATDHDKSGNTRKLVTHCFAVYNVAGHAGLQVELSYEVQDIDRLQAELDEMHEAHERQQRRVRELEEENLRVTRARALTGLESVYQSQTARASKREDKLMEARLMPSTNKAACDEVQREIDQERRRLLKWEKSMREEVLAAGTIARLDDLVERIESRVGLDV